jgi:hypothetical protein
LLAVLVSIRSSVVKNAATIAIITAALRGRDCCSRLSAVVSVNTNVRCMFFLLMGYFNHPPVSVVRDVGRPMARDHHNVEVRELALGILRKFDAGHLSTELYVGH